MADQNPDIQLLEGDAVLAEMLRRLVDQFQPERLYLFGSRARGEAMEDSDYDLLMIVSNSPLPRYQREIEAFRALRSVGAAKDVLVFTRDEFQRKQGVASSLPATVLREGRLLYAA